MDSLLCQLSVPLVNKILVASNFFKRKRSESKKVTAEHQQKLNRSAAKILLEWKKNGVPSEIFFKLQKTDSVFISKFSLNVQHESVIEENGCSSHSMFTDDHREQENIEVSVQGKFYLNSEEDHFTNRRYPYKIRTIWTTWTCSRS